METGVRNEPFLVAPTTGYGAAIDPEKAYALDRAHTSLMRGGSPEAALETAQRWLGDAEAAAPANVLAAQAEYLAEACEGAIARLDAIVAERATYVAAQLVYGSCAERGGDLSSAASSFHAISSRSALARSRFYAIREAAAEQAIADVRRALAAGDVETARFELYALRVWGGEEEAMLATIGDLAAALDDRPMELDLVRALAARGDAGRELRERQAALELEVGDAGAGLEILEELLREWPDDPSIARRLEDARFDWRLNMLPEAAKRLDRAAQLDRGELAMLVYWVFPSVRYQRAANAVIANDVLDHAHRSEIVRVVNLGLMDIDPNLHAFRPGSEATRVEALGAMLRVLAKSPKVGACLDGVTPDSTFSEESICSLAARCGLLPEVGDCLPDAPLSGGAAMELARRTSHELERGG